MRSSSRRSLAIVTVVVLMVIWGSTFVVTKAAAQDISPLTLAALRFLIAAAVLIPVALARGDWKSMPKPMPWLALLGMALTGIATFKFKSQFLANMSHELRTPLNSSLILAKLLADNTPGNLTEEQVKFARNIYSAGNDLLELIDDILNLRKIEARQIDLKRETGRCSTI